ncbi:AAA family ATPase [Methylobacterium sp. NFXW15]|uniref:nucleotide-binding protein n=1 Tax=Methylobacterium sp. NFXW15 TaxID=2819512 RepID=UPI003CF839EA
MRTVVFASQKGGSGKSTLAACMAVAAVQDGENVVCVDLDPQGTLAEWGRLRLAERGEERELVFRTVKPADLQAFVDRVAKHGQTTTLLIDTAGTFDATVDRAVRLADFVLVPVRPSAPDLKAARPTVERLRFLGRSFAFAVNGANPITPARTAEAVAVLQAGGDVAPTVSTRTVFSDAMATGLGVSELELGGKAAAEIAELWTYTKGASTSE